MPDGYIRRKQHTQEKWRMRMNMIMRIEEAMYQISVKDEAAARAVAQEVAEAGGADLPKGIIQWVCVQDVGPTFTVEGACGGGCICSAGSVTRFLGSDGKELGRQVPNYWTHENHGSSRDAGDITVPVPDGTVSVVEESWDSINGGREWKYLVAGRSVDGYAPRGRVQWM
jgi:hypothetical protein